MTNENSTPDEEELRRAIRAEIEERDRLRQQVREQSETVKAQNDQADRRRKIYQEELHKYYHDKPGYREVVREDGEFDWISETEIQRSEGLFDEVLEDPDVAQKRMRWIIVWSAFGLLVLLGLLYFLVREQGGAIQVLTNVPEAQVILDTSPLDRYSNTTLKEITAGPHVVTVQKAGYKILGDPVRRLNLKSGRTEIISFILAPADTTASGLPLVPPADKP